MVTATQILRDEHEAILKMLDVSERVVQQFDRGGKVRPEVLADLLEFFRVFADRCHHTKEEELLFPLLERKGIPREGGPVGVMLHEHEEGRALIKKLAEAAEAYREGKEGAALRWSEAARAYRPTFSYAPDSHAALDAWKMVNRAEEAIANVRS